MNPSQKVIVVLAAVLAAPALVVAAPRTCQPGTATAESYKWNFPKEASQLLTQVQADAYQVKVAADRLETYDREPNLIDWQVDAGLLNRTRDRVNAMDAMLCRLRTIKREVLPWQQKAINRIAPGIVELTGATQSAIRFLNNHQDHLFSPRYRDYANEMYTQAKRVETTIQNLEKSSSARREAELLKKEPYLKG